MKKYAYKKIDAFTGHNSLGNPAACIYPGEDETLTPEEMLTIARQHRGFVSEVVCCSRSKQADAKLAYFSSECEVDFCGHGTVACVYDLVKSNPSWTGKKEIRIETARKGILTVFNELEKEDSVYVTAPTPEYMDSVISAAEIASELGVMADCISRTHPLELIDAGLATLIVPISSLQEVINMWPSESRLKEFCLSQGIDIVLVYSWEADKPEAFAHTRVFAPKFGYLEDSATGSGSSAFGYYMLRNRLWDGRPIALEQGGIGMEYNRVMLTVRDERVLFGGGATVRIQGEYYL